MSETEEERIIAVAEALMQQSCRVSFIREP